MTERNLFGRAYDVMHGVAQYFTIRTLQGYVVARRDADQWQFCELVKLFPWSEFEHAGQCRSAANEHARRLAQEEKR